MKRFETNLAIVFGCGGKLEKQEESKSQTQIGLVNFSSTFILFFFCLKKVEEQTDFENEEKKRMNNAEKDSIYICICCATLLKKVSICHRKS